MLNQKRIVNTFMELVQIDSETLHEQQISTALKKKLAELGLQVVEDDAAQSTGHGSGNLIATLEATDGLQDIPVIFFTAHMDTVSPGIGIKPQLDMDGYIRSDGTTILGSDDKAGIAVILEAIQVLQEQQLPHGKLQFVITVGEESGLRGARAFERSRLQAQYGFALDSSGAVGDVAIAAPAQAKITITIEGRSAHAGVNPEDGISAIQVAGKAISRTPLGRIDKETTANIGRFEGGGATNIVCDRVVLTAEARSIVMDKLIKQVEVMRTAFQHTVDEFGAKLDFRHELLYPSYRIDPEAEIVKVTERAIAATGKKAKLFHSGGGSDANIFNGMGIATVNLAVGYEHIHTTKEQIAAVSLVELGMLVLAIIQEANQLTIQPSTLQN